MNELTLFISTFALVFLLGCQSLSVNGGHYLAAFCTSFGIGAAHLVLYKLAPDATGIDVAAYLMGGPFGIIGAMKAHPHIRRLFSRSTP